MSGGTIVFGNGYIGNRLAALLPGAEIVATDIADREAIFTVLKERRPNVAVNCAGKTGRPNIDWCENHAITTMRSNAIGPVVLAEECTAAGIFMAHVGSGCVYEGDNGGRGFSEEDPPNFGGSLYSLSKSLAERALMQFPVLQLRLRMPVDAVPGPRNLISKLVGYKRIISVPNSVSVLDDFLSATVRLIGVRRIGIYNIVNTGSITQSEILDMYREIVDPAFVYETMTVDDLHWKTKARRSNCVLSTAKIEAEGISLPAVHVAVEMALRRYRSY